MDWTELIKHFGTVGAAFVLAGWFIGKAFCTVGKYFIDQIAQPAVERHFKAVDSLTESNKQQTQTLGDISAQLKSDAFCRFQATLGAAPAARAGG